MPLSESSNIPSPAKLRGILSGRRQANGNCSPVFRCWAVFLILLAGSVPAWGQNQNRPVEKAEAQRREADISGSSTGVAETDDAREADPEVSSDDYTPFGVDIAALVLIADQSKTESKSPTVPAERISIDPEIDQPEELAGLLESYIGKPVSAGLLSDLAKDIILAWRDSDYPLVDVYYPEQNITEGKLQVVVREAVLGDIKVNNVRHSREHYLMNQLRVAAGDRINQRTVRAGLEWLNENPIRTVNLIYDRGQSDGTSDIILEVEEKKSVTVYSGIANTGLNLTGENEFSAGINIANPLKTEQSFGYNFNADIDFDTLEAHTAFYQAYLPWRHKFRLIGAYVSSEASAGGEGFPLDLMGENIQFSGEYEIPLPRPESLDRLRHSLTFATDYKSTNTNLIFGGVDIFDSRAAVMQFRVAYDAVMPDRLGYTKVNLSSVWAPGGILQDNDDESFEALRAESSADYWYGIAELERGIRLPADFSLILRGTGQTTSSRLISTEQLLAGGYRTVRGFDENLIRGDSGGIVNVELVSPEFSILPWVDNHWNLLGFYDAAAMEITELESPGSSETNPSLQSAGVGIRMKVSENIFGRAAYGWVMDAHGFEDVDLKSGKMHFGLTVRY